jgi:hypothetical protein
LAAGVWICGGLAAIAGCSINLAAGRGIDHFVERENSHYAPQAAA